MMRASALVLRDVLLACLIIGVLIMVLLVSSLEHKGGSPPTSPLSIRKLMKANEREASLRVGGSGSGPRPAPGFRPAPVKGWPQKFEPVFSPSPSRVVAPVLPKLYNLRNCECKVGGVKYTGGFEGTAELGKAPAGCTCGGA